MKNQKNNRGGAYAVSGVFRPKKKPKAVTEARTELGKRMRAIRRRIVASGQKLLGWNDLDRERLARRGGAGTDE